MPRYYFNRADGYMERDEEGTESANFDAARIQAVVFAGESLRDEPFKVWSGQDFRVEVTDERGLVLFMVVTIGVESSAAPMRSPSGKSAKTVA